MNTLGSVVKVAVHKQGLPISEEALFVGAPLPQPNIWFFKSRLSVDRAPPGWHLRPEPEDPDVDFAEFLR